MKLGLGTVQFGMPYGVSNVAGVPSREEVSRILQLAEQSGITTLDTAALYGSSEEVLGSCLKPGNRFSIVTKTSKGGDPAELEKIFLSSLAKLKQPRVYGLMIHDAADLLAAGAARLVDKMRELKDRGLVQRIGFSAYGRSQIDAIAARFRELDLIQVPLNYLDQRLIQSGTLSELKRQDYEIHARSAFLQGSLLMDPGKLPPSLASVRNHLIECRSQLSDVGLSPLEGALAFMTSVEEVDRVVIGVTAEAELRQVLAAWNSLKPTPLPEAKRRSFFETFAWSDERVLDPSLWK